jgi:cytochrome P450
VPVKLLRSRGVLQPGCFGQPSALVSTTVYNRRILDEANRLVAEGQLDAPEDVFWLRPSQRGGELETCPTGSLPWREAAARSRARVEAVQQVDLPPSAPQDVIQDRLTRAALIQAAESGRVVFPGIPLNGAVVEGQVLKGEDLVRVLREEMQSKVLGPDTILVVPTLEPSWAVIFPRIGGVVAELGGELSHASILLREGRPPGHRQLRGHLPPGAHGRSTTPRWFARTGRIARLMFPCWRGGYMKAEGAFDFKKDFAFQFPIRIICGMVGISARDIQKVQRWTEESTRSMDTEAGVSITTARRGQKSVAEQRAFFGKLLNDARTRKPSSELVKALAFDGTLDESERIANLSVIIFAGFETTTGLLCKGVCELLKHPDQWAYLRNSLVAGPEIQVHGATIHDVELRWYRWAETEPREADRMRRERIGCLLATSEPLRQRLEAVRRQEAHLDAAIEEMLRWCAPGTIIPLTASQNLEVPVPRAILVRGEQLQPGDKLRIAKGETVTVAVDELNRCCPFGAGEFDKRGEGAFDISRTGNEKHLSFGVKHMCIGATLARENAKRALEGVLRRFPDLQSNGTPIPQDMELFNGLASLPVRSPSMSH